MRFSFFERQAAVSSASKSEVRMSIMPWHLDDVHLELQKVDFRIRLVVKLEVARGIYSLLCPDRCVRKSWWPASKKNCYIYIIFSICNAIFDVSHKLIIDVSDSHCIETSPASPVVWERITLKIRSILLMVGLPSTYVQALLPICDHR